MAAFGLGRRKSGGFAFGDALIVVLSLAVIAAGFALYLPSAGPARGSLEIVPAAQAPAGPLRVGAALELTVRYRARHSGELVIEADPVSKGTQLWTVRSPALAPAQGEYRLSVRSTKELGIDGIFIRLRDASSNELLAVLTHPLQANWLQPRNLARDKPATQSSTSEWSRPNDAQGAVDGRIDGNFGFHTNREPAPWWQVDLGASSPLAEARIFNRIHPEANSRARTLKVLLSDDGVAWRQVYAHDGKAFGGRHGEPLVVDLKGESARYVRLQLSEDTWLHLDEVEIYGR